MPKRFLNKLLFLTGGVGLLFQTLACIYALLHGISLDWHWWFSWLAPLICLLWGIVPRLQLQKEPDKTPPQY
ncbi:hypothetical protein QE250_01515 [Chromatiaceae bacterium AAb-1]|jgi:hypothetical protein|nr:hypothetical protein [Chromatiaceae bacterium AAb-1]